MTKPRLISGNLNEVFNTAISIIFVYQFNVYVQHFFFCVHSNHLGLGTSPVRLEHCNRLFQDKKKSKSTSQYILNFVTQECFQKVHYH